MEQKSFWNSDRLVVCLREPEELLRAAREEERDIEAIRLQDVVISGMDLEQLGFHRVVFHNCRFVDCHFGRTTFKQVKFRECDLSNCDFTWSYWKECEWEEVKAVGIKVQNAKLAAVRMSNCNLKYANMTESKMEKWTAANCDFTDGFLTRCQLKEIVWKENRFIRTSFFETALRGVDFTSCELEGVLVSENGKELAGATVDVYQAAEFAKLFGLRVK